MQIYVNSSFCLSLQMTIQLSPDKGWGVVKWPHAVVPYVKDTSFAQCKLQNGLNKIFWIIIKKKKKEENNTTMK